MFELARTFWALLQIFCSNLLEVFGLVGANGQTDPARLWPNGIIPYTFDREIFEEGANHTIYYVLFVSFL